MIWGERFRRGFEFVVVAICTLALALSVLGIFASYTTPAAAGKRDFVEYWAAARQLAHHSSPYDGPAIGALEHAVSFSSKSHSLVMGNAPWSLLLVLPLSLLSATAGEFFWLAAMLCALIFSMRTLARLHGRSPTILDILGYSFVPVFPCILAGQIGLFILFGLVMFLRWHVDRPFLAGMMLWFCLLKPQLFVPFGIVLLAWCLTRKNYKLVAGVISGLSISTLMVMAFDAHIWTHYRLGMQSIRLDQLAIPCLSSVLRQRLPPHTFWLQCMPALLGSAFALWFFVKRRSDWNWLTHGSLILLVSVLCAPYSWFFDQVILLPAIMAAIYRTTSRTLIALLALTTAIAEILLNLTPDFLHSYRFLWTVPVWLTWYLLAMSSRNKTREATSELSHVA